MSLPNTEYLRLFTHSTRAVQESPSELAHLEEMCDQFERATGWPLQFHSHAQVIDDHDMLWSAPVESAGGLCGHLTIQWGARSAPLAPLHDAIGLAETVLDTFNRWLKTQKSLTDREAELAAGVPLVSATHQVPGLAQRLENSLRMAAQAVDCQAAGLYMLDAGTSELKLRSAWNLPADRLHLPPRPLDECPADLEAMAGHAIAIENPVGGLPWRLPEQFAAGLCLPVSGPETVLGTVWFYGVAPRDFTDTDVQLAEMAAAALAAELDRAMLRREIAQAADALKAQNQVQQCFRDLLPNVAPQLEHFLLAGRTDAPQGRAFHDWFPGPNGTITTVVAQIETSPGAEMLAATTLRGLLRAHGSHVHSPHELLGFVNRSLYSASAGDQQAAIAAATVCARTGRMQVATAGKVGALALKAASRWKVLSKPQAVLGMHPDATFRSVDVPLMAGDEVVFFAQVPRGKAPAIPPAACYSAVASACVAYRNLDLGQALTNAQDRLWPQSRRSMAAESCLLMLRSRKDTVGH